MIIFNRKPRGRLMQGKVVRAIDDRHVAVVATKAYGGKHYIVDKSRVKEV